MSGPLFIAIAALLWAFDGVLRRSLFTLPPITIVFLEHVIGLLVLLPFFLKKIRAERVTMPTLKVIAVVSLFSGLLGTLFFTTALVRAQFIPFSVVFLLQKLQPIFAIVSARLVLKEKIHRSYALLAAIALVAAYFVTFPLGHVNFATGAGTLMAALFALGAAFFWGTSTAFSRLALKSNSPTVVTGLRFLMTIGFGVVALFALGAAGSLVTVTPTQLGTLLLIAVSTGMVALYVYYQGLKRTPVRVATIVELIFPATAVAIDAFLYKTTLHPSQYIAAIILVISIARLSYEQQAGVHTNKTNKR